MLDNISFVFGVLARFFDFKLSWNPVGKPGMFANPITRTDEISDRF